MSELVGKVIAGRYRVDAFLGKGGMADVYKVWDSHRSTLLAMKVLQADLALDHIFLRRFKREAQTLSQLQHPNIVRFYGLEQEDRIVFMLMDYVEGESLKHKIFDANGPMPFDQVMSILTPVCQALQYAHNEGFVHSDVKPANILVEANGRVMLSDFGIARMTEATTMTLAGAGTPAYMSPEQVRGENPSPQTDIYALGIVMFEMLTGERPFSGEHARTSGSTSERVLWEQTNLRPPSMKKLNPRINPALEAVVMKCMEKVPSNRFVSMDELTRALHLINAAPNKDLKKTLTSTSTTVGVQKNESVSDPTSKVTRSHDTPRVEMGSGSPPQQPGRRKPSKLPWMIIAALIIILIISATVFGLGPRGSTLPTVTSTSTFTVTNTKVVTLTPAATETSAPTPTLGIGYTRERPQDGMVMVNVPAGEFTMGMDADDALVLCQKYYNGCQRDWFIAEEPSHTVYLDAYMIDSTEVTNSMYKICVEAGKCAPPAKNGSFSRANYYENPEFGDFPVNFVSWYDAKGYCEWAGARLPTEAEWEKAARGMDGRIYPWGNSKPSCNRANYGTCLIDTTMVGSYLTGASPYGALDMAGNVWEWVNDWFDPGYYSSLGSGARNPQGPDSGDTKVMKGGSWLPNGSDLRASGRNWYHPVESVSLIGFRCVNSLP